MALVNFFRPNTFYNKGEYCIGPSRILDGGIANASNYIGSNTPNKAFDKDLSTKWAASNAGGDLWISYDNNEAVTLIGYLIYSANDIPGRDLKSWIFEGSNDGNSWAELHKVDDDPGWVDRGAPKCFELDTFAAYRYFRIKVTDTQILESGDIVAQIAEIKLVTTSSNPENYNAFYAVPANYTSTANINTDILNNDLDFAGIYSRRGDNNLTFFNVTENHSIHVVFDDGFFVNATFDRTRGSIIGIPADCPVTDLPTYDIDDPFPECAVPCFRACGTNGYKIKSLTLDGEEHLAAAGQLCYEFSPGPMFYDHTLELIWTDKFLWTASISGQGTTNPVSGYELDPDILNPISAIPSAHWHVASIKDNGNIITPTFSGKTASYSVDGTTNHRSIILFKEDSYLTLIEKDHSSVLFNNVSVNENTHNYYNQGSTVNIKVNSDNGYYIKTVEVDGILYQVNAEAWNFDLLNFPTMEEGKVIKVAVTTSDNPVLTTVVQSGTGTVTGGGSYSYGDTPVITFVPGAGFFPYNVTLTNSQGSTYFPLNGLQLTLPPIYENETLTVDFLRGYLIDVERQINECGVNEWQHHLTRDTVFKISNLVENKIFIVEFIQDATGGRKVFFIDDLEGIELNFDKSLPITLTPNGVTTYQFIKTGNKILATKIGQK